MICQVAQRRFLKNSLFTAQRLWSYGVAVLQSARGKTCEVREERLEVRTSNVKVQNPYEGGKTSSERELNPMEQWNDGILEYWVSKRKSIILAQGALRLRIASLRHKAKDSRP